MRTFIQLRDNIGYAIINTAGDLDHSITPDHTTAIEVFTENPEQFLKKIYNFDSQSWSDAPIYRYAEINESGEIVDIKRTVFLHEISNELLIMPNEANGLWKFINGEWLPNTIIIEQHPPVIDSPETIENVDEDTTA